MEKKFPTESLEGARVRLARYKLTQAESMFRTIDEDRARLRRYLPWVDLIVEQRDEESYIRSSTLQWMEQTLFDYGIFRKSDGLYLGNIGAHTISWEDDRCEIGYWLSGSAEGQGYMAEALGLLEQELFAKGFHRIEIRCNQKNLRSAGVPNRAGYALEGILHDDVLENGVRRNSMVWAKLRPPEKA